MHPNKKYKDIPNKWVTRYNVKKNKARWSKQEWEFTIHTWYKVWKDSGKLDRIAKMPGCYRMARVDPYDPWWEGNVKIVQVTYSLLRNLHRVH